MKRVMSFITNIFGIGSVQAIVIRKVEEKLIVGINTKPDETFFHDQYDWNYLPQFQEYLNQPLEQIMAEDQEFVKALRKGTIEELIITCVPKYKTNGYDVFFIKNIGTGDEFAQHIADFIK